MSELLAPWATARTRRRLRELQAASRPGDADDEARVAAASRSHARAMDLEGLVLYAGTNACAADATDDAQLGMRPSMGDPGEKLQPGLEHVEVLEVLATRAVAATLRAPHADVRLQSATLANLAVYAALAPVEATIAVLPLCGGGHASHRAEGAAGIRGHRIVELPYDPGALDVDLDALPAFLRREQPALVVVGGSLFLFPTRLRQVAAAAQVVEARVLYDASHVAGLIAGGRFQDPLAEGADAVTFSTYKSYGGPPGGAVATADATVAERVARTVYPGLTANYDAGRLRALHAAATRLLRDGGAYADRCIATAQALGRALDAAGATVLAAERGYSASHHLAVVVGSESEAASAAQRLAAAGIFCSAAPVPGPAGALGALRFGTQELVTRGLGVEDMTSVAGLVVRVLLAGEPPHRVRADVRAVRSDGRAGATRRAGRRAPR